MADALSRRVILLTTLKAQVVGFEEIKNHYGNDSFFSLVLKELKEKPPSVATPYAVHEGYLFKNNQLCIPEGSFREKIIREPHRGGLGGHFG